MSRHAKSSEIKNSRQAFREMQALKSCWSAESLLSLRTEIYIASLLERILHKKKRKLSAWQVHLSRTMKEGKSIQQAKAEYKRPLLKVVGK